MSRHCGAVIFYFYIIAQILLCGSPALAQIRLVETGAPFTEYVGFQAPAAIATNFTWTLPAGDGTVNQCLSTNGSGVLGWTTPVATVADGDKGDITVSGTGATWLIDASYVGSANITTLGTIGTGTWNATTIGVSKGGTGATTLTTNQLLVGNGTSAISAILPGSSGQILRSSGAASNPAWSTATYPATTTANRILYSSAGNAVGEITSANRGVLATDGSGVPTITSVPTLGIAGGATGTLTLAGTTSGAITIQPQGTAGTYNFNLPNTVGTAGQVLTSQGGGGTAMTWTTAGTGTVTAVSVASANGFAGSSSGGATPALTISTSVNGILKGNGTSVAAAIAGDFPTLNQSTTGTAANVTGVVALANGGTGTSTALTQGSVHFAGASGAFTQDNANFFWDDTNNRLGIGTAAPTSKISVVTTTASTTAGGFSSGATTGSNFGLNVFSDGVGATANTGMFIGATGATTNKTISIPSGYPAAGANNWAIYSASAAQSYFAGNVGIGTSTPAGVLHVVTPMNTDTNQPAFFAPLASATDFNEILLGKSAASSFQAVHLRYVYGGGGAGTGYLKIANHGLGDQLVVHGNGNVGINTNSPGSALHVVGQAGGWASQFMGSGGVGGNFGPYIAAGSNSSDISFLVHNYNGSVPQLYIRGDGYTGMGTNTPTAMLHIKTTGPAGYTAVLNIENPAVNSGDKGGIVWGQGTYGFMDYDPNSGFGVRYSALGPLVFGTNTAASYGSATFTENMRIQSDGNVGIGTNNPVYKLDVRGGQVAGAGVFVNTSDVRLKKDIEPIQYGLDAILKLRPVGFNWKDQSQEWAKQHQIGLIAQEAEQVVPEIVSTANDPERMKSIAYGAIAPVLIKAVQELHGMCREQQGEIVQLRSEMQRLKEENAALKAAICEMNPQAKICN